VFPTCLILPLDAERKSERLSQNVEEGKEESRGSKRFEIGRSTRVNERKFGKREAAWSPFLTDIAPPLFKKREEERGKEEFSS